MLAVVTIIAWKTCAHPRHLFVVVIVPVLTLILNKFLDIEKMHFAVVVSFFITIKLKK